MTDLLEARPHAELADLRPAVEVLFAEARQRGRRRRAIYVLVGFFVAIALVAVAVVVVPPLFAPRRTAESSPGSPTGALGTVTAIVITAESLNLVTVNGHIVERLRYTDSDSRITETLTALLGRPGVSPTPFPKSSTVLTWPALIVHLDYKFGSFPPRAQVYALAKARGRIAIRTEGGIAVGQSYSKSSDLPYVYSKIQLCPQRFVRDSQTDGAVIIVASPEADRVSVIEAPIGILGC